MPPDAIQPMPTFSSRSEFWRELKAAARDHLAVERSRGRPPVGDPRLKRKAAAILIWFGLSYGALLCAPTAYAALAATISLALAAAALGFGVFHDAAFPNVLASHFKLRLHQDYRLDVCSLGSGLPDRP